MAVKTESRDDLILQHFGMVQRVAARMSSRYPSSVEVDDLVSIGTLGLIDAANRFDAERNATFTSYALIRIKGAIVDELRKQDWVPRTVRARNRDIELAKAQATKQNGVPNTPAIAEALGIQVGQLADMERDSQIYTQVSMWERRSDTDQQIADTLESDDATPGDDLMSTDLRRVVMTAVSDLPERDQQIVQMYYYEDRSFREIGDVLGVTESRISQIHSRIKRRLKESLGERP